MSRERRGKMEGVREGEKEEGKEARGKSQKQEQRTRHILGSMRCSQL